MSVQRPHERHRREGPASVACFVVTSSRSRSLRDDEGGDLAARLLANAGHRIAGRQVVPDDAAALRRLAAEEASRCADVLVITGGTGLAPHDVTLEALEPLWTKRLPGFGEIFRQLSFAEIGAAAMLSRAAAGSVGRLLVFALPGSPAAVRLALEKLVLPELSHAVGLLAQSP